MQRLENSTSNLIPKPKLNAEVQDSVSNENRSLFQAKAIWIRDAKRFIIKESKNPFHNSEYASLAFVQRVIKIMEVALRLTLIYAFYLLFTNGINEAL